MTCDGNDAGVELDYRQVLLIRKLRVPLGSRPFYHHCRKGVILWHAELL